MIKDVIRYREDIFKDFGLYIAIIMCILYLTLFRPWVEDLDIINKRVWIGGISLAIITLSAAFCYQAHNFLKSVDLENEFYNKLLVNEILDEVQFLYRWSVYSGIFNIVSLVAYNVLINSRMLDDTILGVLAIVPIFSTVYLLSEFINNMVTGVGLSKYNLDYKKIHSKSKR